ncbi:transposition protein, TnsC-like protein [Stutzerimonas stutzeri ATCC 14405 = CCUG 16156]|nr:transposition protein, TnsC-like protein [Stutzerimonas stutzeri ATCC 14405 = CCUG 16156]
MIEMTEEYLRMADPARITQKITVTPEPLVGLSDLHPVAAAYQLRSQLTKLYLPTEFVVGLISELLVHSSLLFSDRYSNERSYAQHVYTPFESGVVPLCLTGLAGIGKSRALIAIRDYMPGPGTHFSNLMHGEIKNQSHLYASANAKDSARQVIEDLCISLDIEVSKQVNAAKLLSVCRRQASISRVTHIFIDEMQFFTKGNSTDSLAKLLLSVASIGIPTLYLCNFSLLHKLFTRNSEDRHRLLSQPKIMTPDLPDSRDWRLYILACDRALGGVFKGSNEVLVRAIYDFTFGIKRFVVELITLSYLIARSLNSERLTLDMFRQAYFSVEYTAFRQDVMLLNRQAIENKASRRDLWCPFELPPGYKTRAAEIATESRNRKFSMETLKSALSMSERKALNEHFPSKRAPIDSKQTLKSREAVSSDDAGLIDALNLYSEILSRPRRNIK